MTYRWLSQEAIENAIGQDLLGRIESLAPVLGKKEADEVSLYTKANLVRLLESFGTAGLMRDKKFFGHYIECIPPDSLTKLCRATEACEPGLSYETKADAIKRKGWKDPDYCRMFCQAVGLPEEIVPVKKIRVEDSDIVACPPSPFKQLIDYQFKAMEGCCRALESPRARVVLQMPTGSGKTRTAMELVCRHFAEVGLVARVVWLAHSEELCDQAVECVRETWQHLGRSELAIRRMYSGMKSYPKTGRSEFIVASFQTLHSLAETNSFWSVTDYPTSLVVVDEAHKVLAPTYKKVTEKLVSSNTRVLGLTATPGRGMDDPFGNQALADFFFGSIVPLEAPPGGSAIEYLRQRKVLAHADQIALEVSTEFELTEAEKKRLETSMDYPPGLLKRIGGDDIRNLEILQKLRELLTGGRQCLFFACSVDHSKFICALLNYLGIKSRHLDGGTDKGERRGIIESFKKQEYAVLCNYGVLATGFDAPNVDIVFIARPTKSIVLYSQMIGRGLRGPRVGGTESCTIVNVIDNFVGMPSNDEIFEYFDEYWSL